MASFINDIYVEAQRSWGSKLWDHSRPKARQGKGSEAEVHWSANREGKQGVLRQSDQGRRKVEVGKNGSTLTYFKGKWTELADRVRERWG